MHLPPKLATIYMPLLGEGVDVWRPVAAEHLEGSTYRIADPVPSDEHWTYPTNTKVVCEARTFSDGTVLVAVRLAE
jgi:hypothetical protein